MSKLEVKTSAEDLMCLMHRSLRAERVPEPIRLQPDIQLGISFDVYKEAILSMPTEAVLSAPVNKLRKEVEQGSKELVRNYYLDVSYAILKELCYARFCKQDATIILPNSGGNLVNVSDLVNMYQLGAVDFEKVSSEMLQYEYRLDWPAKSEHNQVLLKLALTLWKIAKESLEPPTLLTLVFN